LILLPLVFPPLVIKTINRNNRICCLAAQGAKVSMEDNVVTFANVNKSLKSIFFKKDDREVGGGGGSTSFGRKPFARHTFGRQVQHIERDGVDQSNVDDLNDSHSCECIKHSWPK
jgi:hypothetical protein